MNNAIFLLIFVGQLINVSPQNETKIKIHTTKDEAYTILTRNQPVEIKVSGPTWIRVYTRIPWTGEKKGTKVYKLILQEDDIKEKFITRETEYSSVARLDKIRLSKWRSFYINVPQGLHTYRFIYWRAPSDTILMRFTSESPGRWQDIPALSYNRTLELIEDEKIINYYEATIDKPVIIEIEGPKKLKITSRLHIPANVQSDQLYTITVKEKDRTIKTQNFWAYRSETVGYNKQTDLIPSNPHTFYLNVRKGTHRYEFWITNGAGCGLRFMAEIK